MVNNTFQTDLKTEIKNISSTEQNRNQFTDLYVVEKFNSYADVAEDSGIKEFTCDIKQMNGVQKFTNVPILSQGLGNGRGLMMPPQRGDVIAVIFYGQSNQPLIIGNVFNSFMQGKRFKNVDGVLTKVDSGANDNILDVGIDEWILINALNGGYIFGKSDGSIKIKNSLGYFMLKATGELEMNGMTFPLADGSAGQVLKTDGNGVLTWENDSTI